MNKTYAVSDIHGMKPLWDQIMKYLDPNDTLYCLGDCADRGNDGWEIIKDAIADKRVIYLKGNHENMLLETMKDYLKDEGFYYDYALLCNNGGAKHLKTGKLENMLILDGIMNLLNFLYKKLI